MGSAFPDRIVDDSFGSGGLTLDQNDSIAYRLGIFEDNGTYVVCAAAQNANFGDARRILSSLKVTVNRQTLQRGLRWARIHNKRGSLNGEAAACRQTSVAVVSDPVFNVELTKRRF